MESTKHRLVSYVPFAMIFLDCLSGYVRNFEFYKVIYPFLGMSIGHSIATNLVFTFLYFRRSYCLATKAAVVGLYVLNIISAVWTYSAKYSDFILSEAYKAIATNIVMILIFLVHMKWKESK